MDILMDGRHWHFFYPIGKENYENRKVRELDLLESDSEASAARVFCALFFRESVTFLRPLCSIPHR